MSIEKMNEENTQRYLDAVTLIEFVPAEYIAKFSYGYIVNRTMALLDVLGDKETAKQYLLEHHSLLKDIYKSVKIQNAGISGAYRQQQISADLNRNYLYGATGSNPIDSESIKPEPLNKGYIPQFFFSSKHYPTELEKNQTEPNEPLAETMKKALEGRRRVKRDLDTDQSMKRFHDIHNDPFIYGSPEGHKEFIAELLGSKPGMIRTKVKPMSHYNGRGSVMRLVGESERRPSFFVDRIFALYDIVKDIVDFNEGQLDRKRTVLLFTLLGCHKPKRLANGLIKKLIHKPAEQWIDVVIGALIHNDPYRFGELRGYLWFTSKDSSKRKSDYRVWTESELLAIVR